MEGMWCFVGRMVARSVVAAGDHGGEKKRKAKTGCRNRAGKAYFVPISGPFFLNPLTMKIPPIYRAGKRVILSSMGKNSQLLIRLE